MEKTENKELILSKKLHAQKLLKEGKSFTQVQKSVKLKFKTDFSNRDLVKIKASIVIIPKDLKVYIDAFEVCFSVLCNIREKNPQAQDIVNEFADLFFDLEKKRILDALPEDLRMDDIILNGMEMIDRKKEMYISNKEIK